VAGHRVPAGQARRRILGSLLLLALLTLALVALAPSAASAQDPLTFTVNSTADTNDGFCTVSNCTLREAIERSNTRAGTDTITFAIPGPPPHTIRPTISALPPITDRATIDARPSCSGAHEIVIDGSQAGDADGLRIATSVGGTLVRGLVIGGFDSPARAGVRFEAGANTVECSLIGTDASGQAPNPNHHGVVFAAPAGQLTRSSVASANNSHGVLFQGTNTSSSISNGFIGTNATGTAPLPNGVGVLNDWR
jgi:CSLREA domain-containing protein